MDKMRAAADSVAHAAVDIGPINLMLIAIAIVGFLVLVVGLVLLLAFDGKGVAWFAIVLGALLSAFAGVVWLVQWYRRYKNNEKSGDETVALV